MYLGYKINHFHDRIEIIIAFIPIAAPFNGDYLYIKSVIMLN